MSTLLLRLAAPLQSWGVNAKFDRRSTERLPTKSGVVGLVAAALGRRRNESLNDLLALRFGVRVDQEGALLRDYQTAKSKNAAYVTHRYYLSDAVFLAGLEGDEALLAEIDYALHYPEFPLFLGRRACPPEGRLSLGIRRGKTILEALTEEPWLASNYLRRKPGTEAGAEVCLRIVTDGIGQEPNSYLQRDVPISFNQIHRQFGFRRVHESGMLAVPNTSSRYTAAEGLTEHDPLAELEGD